MRSSVLLLSLALCLGGAAAILWGGSRLGFVEEKKRIVADREPLKAGATAFQRECLRLDRLYERHLRRLPVGDELMSDYSLRKECSRLAGLQQVSFIFGEDGGRDRHLAIGGQQDLPQPFVTGTEWTPSGNAIGFEAAELFAHPLEDSGWIDDPARPLFYWTSGKGRSAVLFLIDRDEVAQAMTDWLEARPELAGKARPAGQPWEKEPDFLLPVHSRFGTWELGDYDRFETTKEARPLVLASSAVLSLLLAGGGLFAFVLQRRSIRLAEQRVSFVNQVSHELRTPLTNIRLNADLAAERVREEDPETFRRLGLVRDESRRLGRLIENVLTFSKKDRRSGSIQERPVVVDELVEEVLDQFGPALERRGIEVQRQGSAPEELVLDGDAFAQILSNLVSNVEKYAANGKLLQITTELTGSSLAVTVRDAGEGIEPRDRKRIFEAFQRLGHDSTEGASGTGLGLSIARDLAKDMGGALELQSSDQGAAFTLRLPARAA